MDQSQTTTLNKNNNTMMPNLREVYFEIPGGVAVYGGFDGTETALVERDNITGNPTVLSGEIQQDFDNTNNAYHVVVFNDNPGVSSTLDGVIVTGGYADVYSATFPHNTYGAGIYSYNSIATIRNCIITDNHAEDHGGGMYCQNSPMTIENTEISNNSADIDPSGFRRGGGIYFQSCDYVTLEGLTVSENTAHTGAGIFFNGSSPVIIDRSIFSGNTFISGGGGIYSNSSTTFITNSLFSGNHSDYHASHGGAIMLKPGSTSEMTNVTITGNAVQYSAGGIHSDEAPYSIANSIVYNNSAGIEGHQIYNNNTDYKITYSNIESGDVNDIVDMSTTATFSNNIYEDPLFMEPLDPADAPSTDGNFHLLGGSPSINTGLNDSVTTVYDLDGNARIFNSNVDMGAYEAQAWGDLIVANPIPDFEVFVGKIYVKTTIYVGDVFADPDDSTAEITTTLDEIDDVITGRHCCNCCVDTLIFGGVEDGVLSLGYIKYLDGIGTITLKGESDTHKRGFTDFNVSVISVISDTTNCDGDDTTDVSTDELANIPETYELQQNYPNPFNPTTVVPFAIPEKSDVQLTLYDLNGRKIQSMKAVNLNAGYHKFRIDGSTLPAGIYIYKLQAGDFFEFKKMTLLK
jgi:hypothetical protein